MSLQPYTLAFHHALELDDFLEEADITTTDLFAVLGNERYRKSLKNDIKTIVDEYKEQGRDPPPHSPGPSPLLAINHGEYGSDPCRIEAGQRRTGPSARQTTLPASAPPTRDILMLAVPGASIDSPIDLEMDGCDTPPVLSQNHPPLAIHPTAAPVPAPRYSEALIEFVPGTRIKLRHQTAPQTWTYLHNHDVNGSGMSFVARVSRHVVTKWKGRVVELDFGNGDIAAMLVSKSASSGLYHNIETTYARGSFIRVQNITRLVQDGCYFLHFGSGASIQRLVNVTQKTIATINARCNRKRKRSYDNVVETFRGQSSAFVAGLERPRREGDAASRARTFPQAAQGGILKEPQNHPP
ncbi:uncharacterized protein SPSC_03130 [Sporisorium scitamineum]|uniref:Uncharacterized protein n=1 Tax=Sporisorium scitamineum TaxID=49012 RepID=A0A127Z6Y7_9BASI|nr:uncharacterized protein SPSC_03130 [Sporisorium scitamineum]